jgi:hypothetical protein
MLKTILWIIASFPKAGRFLRNRRLKTDGSPFAGIPIKLSKNELI